MTPNKITRNVKHCNELPSSVMSGEGFQGIVMEGGACHSAYSKDRIVFVHGRTVPNSAYTRLHEISKAV